ncbi:hypothetical protein NDU88_004850 [Pleurodeles waltl]|uniref:Uncharacterized protein n=1 Tax=Pleurodeles waltl TaxID=8319 RepID=A0AAV7T9A4_PLEWA|nr:hypothetical protein NDU88_004850 [Pleurodeles waltl]
MCFTAPAGAPAVPGRRHECGASARVGPSRKIPARAPPAGRLAFPVAAGKSATGNASLPLVALGPESSGSGPTLALARIHAGAPGTAGAPAGAVKHIEAINLKRPAFALDHIHAGVPAWPVRPPLRQSYRG